LRQTHSTAEPATAGWRVVFNLFDAGGWCRPHNASNFRLPDLDWEAAVISGK